ncbi:MAG: hydrogenase subunit MbhD domain-containing protein [Dermatophilaceae bacterium]|nr:DUF4040 domain-containing protein [Intrasporangiaceae bacterium]
MTGTIGGAAGPVEVAVAAAVLLAAGVALFGRRRMTSVVGFLVLGALLSLYWALIGAPDVALAEAAIGTGVTGALFVAAVTLLGRDADIRPSGPAVTALSLAAGAALAALVGLGLTRGADTAGAAPDRPGLGGAVESALADTGVDHPVTGVLLSFRSLDTLMEMVVLLAAAAIALAFLPRVAPAEPATPAPSGLILDRFVRLVAPLLLLLAVWVLVAGSGRPGGAFQSGAVLAATLILLHLGGLLTLRVRPLLRVALAAGVAAFVLVAGAGLEGGGSWLQIRGPAAGQTILALESVLAVTIGASLATVFLALGSAAHRQREDVS